MTHDLVCEVVGLLILVGLALIFQTLKKQGIRTTIDDRNETIGKKIRENELQKIPYCIIVGDREAESKTISVRRHKKGDLGKMTLNEFLKMNKE